jgi:membrane protein
MTSGSTTAPSAAPEGRPQNREPAPRSRMTAARERVDAMASKIRAGAAGRYWSHLTAADFMNSSLAFAALAVVCAFPFLAVVSAAVGTGGVRRVIITRMGLDAKASNAVDGLISSGHEVSTLTALSVVLLLVGALGMASTLQSWYQKIYDQPPVKAGLRSIGYQALGLVAFSAYITASVYVLHALRHVSPVLTFSLTLVFSTLFWWVSAYFLLYGRLGWRQVLPAGVATGLCITGLGVFSSLLFSDQIVEGEASYGPAGVVLGITSYLIGFGVCLHLGAVFGRVWNDSRTQRVGTVSAPAPDPHKTA